MKMQHKDFADLKSIPVGELEKMRSAIDAEINEKRDQELLQVAERVKELARASGFQIEEIMPFLVQREERPVKYRHPQNPELTWCGRGRRPLWMTEALADGITMAEMTL